MKKNIIFMIAIVSLWLSHGIAHSAESQRPYINGSGKVYYSDCNSDGPTTPFYEYDVVTDTWAERASIPYANATQLTNDENGNVYSLPKDGGIYRYDTNIDSWVFVMSGPPDSVGLDNRNFFEAHNGEFYWGPAFGNTLYYTVNSIWNTISTPMTVSAGSAVDRATGLIYIRISGRIGFFSFDPTSATFPNICEDGDIGVEPSRVGAFYNGEFFSRDQFGTYQAINVSNCDQRDTGVAPTSWHSSTAEDIMGNIYSNGWGPYDTIFEVFNAATNTLTRLADAPDIPDNNHSTLVAVWDYGLEVLIDIKPGGYPNSINLKSKGKVPVAILTTDDFDAYDVDPETCVFAGAGPLRWIMYDLGKDGDDDIILHFKTQDLEDLNKDSTEASIECETYAGIQITGTDSVKIVPKCSWQCNKYKKHDKKTKKEKSYSKKIKTHGNLKRKTK